MSLLNQEGGSIKNYGSTITPGKVAVIGAGIAGLQSLRSLVARSEKDLSIVGFEVEDGCGGQWHHNYSSLKIQVSNSMYQFPDAKAKESKNRFLPSCEQVKDQCQAYMEQFGLGPLIRFSTEVVAISEGTEKAWKLEYRKVLSYERSASPGFDPVVKPEGESVTEEFDYVIVATGPFSHRLPYVPRVPGMEAFQGEILHSSTNLQPKSEAGKKVVVVGGCKSANDQAIQACDSNAASVTQIMRRAHWGCPDLVMGVIPFEYFFSSRFGEGLVHTYSGTCAPPIPWSPIRRILNVFLRPISWLMMQSFGSLFIFQESLHGVMRPKMDIIRNFHTHGYAYSPAHRMYRKEGKIVPKLGEITSYEKNGVNVREDDGTEKFYECDMVVYGTGFKKRYNYFSPQVLEKLGNTSHGLCLYRQILHPELPNLAFVGSEFNTITNMTTSALQAEWVARWIAGDQGEGFRPSREEMKAQIDEKKAWLHSLFEPTNSFYNTDIQQINYGDTLLMDMGEPCYRKMPNLFAEFFLPYCSADYDGLVGRPLKHKSSGVRKARTGRTSTY